MKNITIQDINAKGWIDKNFNEIFAKAGDKFGVSETNLILIRILMEASYASGFLDGVNFQDERIKKVVELN